MFFVEGWYPLSAFTREIYQIARTKLVIEETGEGPSHPTEGAKGEMERLNAIGASMTAQFVWQVCEDCQSIGVLTSSGSIVKALPELVHWWDPSEYQGFHVNLWDGVVGTSRGADFDDHRQLVLQADVDILQFSIGNPESYNYGPFEGLPVLLPAPDCARARERYSGQPVSVSTDRFHEQVARQIVEAFDSGQTPTKRDARARFASGMKVAEFEATWRIAANSRPALSRPGPRTSR